MAMRSGREGLSNSTAASPSTSIRMESRLLRAPREIARIVPATGAVNVR